MERARWMILCTIQPHIKKKLTNRDIAIFDWEKDTEKSKPLPPEEIDKIVKRLKGKKLVPISPKKLLNG